MSYKPETIREMIQKANELIDYYTCMEVDEIRLCISQGNDKIGHTRNVSLMPILSCGNCKHCKDFCYDVKACVRFKDTTLDARIRNWVLLLKDRYTYFSLIEKELRPRIRNKFFRWHVAGDIIDENYLANMVAIAKRHADWKFWTYTKMYHVVNHYCETHGGKAAIPENLRIMFSEWDGVALENPYGFPIFTVKMKNGNKNHAPEYFDTLYKCPGNCDICKKACRGCIAGEDTYNDEH